MIRLLAAFLLLAFSQHAVAQQTARTVTGHVTSADDSIGLPGVNIVVMGAARGTTTDVDGNYTIELSPSDAALVFTFVGYKTTTIQVGDRTTINITLQPEATSLDE